MGRHAFGWGLFLVVGGILLLLSNLGYIDIDPWWKLWPLLLVWWGLTNLWGSMRKKE